MYNIFLEMDPPTSTSQENKVAIVNGRMMHYKSKGAKQTFGILTAALKPFTPPSLMNCIRSPTGHCMTS